MKNKKWNMHIAIFAVFLLLQISSITAKQLQKKTQFQSQPSSPIKPIEQSRPEEPKIVIMPVQQWQKIPLPNVYMAPDTNELTVNGQLYRPQPKIFESKLTSPTSYKLKFPSPSNTMWFGAEKACRKINNQDVYRNPQTCLRSDYIPSTSGLSFLGKVDKTNIGSSEENHFAIFFHEKECYDGGPEYGFAFYEKMKTALFYICNDCNQGTQFWWDWPGKNGWDIKSGRVRGQQKNQVAQALMDPSQEHYWNIKILENGNFVIQVINPRSNETSECTITKPNNFPNLYQKGGYITVNAKRADNSTTDIGSFELKEVRILK